MSSASRTSGAADTERAAHTGADLHPAELRVDNSVIRTGAGEEVRLPYLKFPRNPEQR